MYQYSCIIDRVVDGDTVDVSVDLGFDMWKRNCRIRLSGIDAPESRTTDLVEKQFGLLSKSFVESTLPVGSRQTLVTKAYDASGKYGRTLGTFIVFDATTDAWIELSDIMLRDGYATPYLGGSKEEIQQMHMNNRRKLIESGAIDMTLEEAGL